MDRRLPNPSVITKKQVTVPEPVHITLTGEQWECEFKVIKNLVFENPYRLAAAMPAIASRPVVIPKNTFERLIIDLFRVIKLIRPIIHQLVRAVINSD